MKLRYNQNGFKLPTFSYSIVISTPVTIPAISSMQPVISTTIIHLYHMQPTISTTYMQPRKLNKGRCMCKIESKQEVSPEMLIDRPSERRY